jgi:hypothetical protein
MVCIRTRLCRPLKKSEQQIPRGLKPARDDKNNRLERGAEAPHYPNKAQRGLFQQPV